MDPGIGSGHDFAGFLQIGSALVQFLLITFRFLNQYESSNTTFGMIIVFYDV